MSDKTNRQKAIHMKITYQQNPK